MTHGTIVLYTKVTPEHLPKEYKLNKAITGNCLQKTTS